MSLEATSAFRGSSGTAQFACGKFALRALSQSIAKEFGKQGIHSVHVRLDCVLDTPGYQKKMPDMYAAHKTWGDRKIVSNSFLLLLVRHLFLVAWHLFLVASCYY